LAAAGGNAFIALFFTDEPDSQQVTGHRTRRFRKVLDAAALQIAQLHQLLHDEIQHAANWIERFDVVEPVSAHIRMMFPQVREDSTPEIRLISPHRSSSAYERKRVMDCFA